MSFDSSGAYKYSFIYMANSKIFIFSFHFFSFFTFFNFFIIFFNCKLVTFLIFDYYFFGDRKIFNSQLNMDASKFSPSTLVLTTAVTASVVSIGATLGVQALLLREKRRALEEEVETKTQQSKNTIQLNEFGIPTNRSVTPAASNGGGATKKPLFGGESTNSSITAHDEDLIQEQLARNRAFLGEEGLQKVRNSFVVVVGAGGVGSWVATMLVRSGVSKIRIIDFDQVTLSSLNRHANATLADVGTPKVIAMERHLKQIAPWCEIESVVALWDKNKQGYDTMLSKGNPTWVVDAIDNIDTKVDLLDFCYNVLKVPVISAMGAGCKSDPTRVNIADISLSLEDPLARSTRRRLRQRGIVTGIPVVFSAEKPSPEKAALLPLSETAHEEGPVDQLAVLQDFRVRILPVLGPLPAIFGLTIATHILTITANYPGVTDPLQGGYSLAGKRRSKLYDSALQSLAGQLARLHWSNQRVPIDMNDVGYLIEEVFRGKSPISGESTKLSITLWNPPTVPEFVDFNNLVVLTKEEQKIHEKEILRGGKSLDSVYSKNALAIVNKRLEEQKWYSQFR